MLVDIEYCVPCGLRQDAVEVQLSLLDAYGDDLDGVRLTPGHGGVFRVTADGETIWDKDLDGGIDADDICSRLDA